MWEPSYFRVGNCEHADAHVDERLKMPGLNGGGGHAHDAEAEAEEEEEETQQQALTTCSDLPDDVLRALLSHLPTAALPGAAAVCRRW
jgi:hypothetical protein